MLLLGVFLGIYLAFGFGVWCHVTQGLGGPLALFGHPSHFLLFLLIEILWLPVVLWAVGCTLFDRLAWIWRHKRVG